jgi:hypothetical protein
MTPVKLFDNTILVCPACGGEHLHHDLVSVYHRGSGVPMCRADVGGLAFGVSTAVTLNVPERENPSVSRGGVAIRFWCEGCHTYSDLTIAQHEGSSFVEWRSAGMSCPGGRNANTLDTNG